MGQTPALDTYAYLVRSVAIAIRASHFGMALTLIGGTLICGQDQAALKFTDNL